MEVTPSNTSRDIASDEMKAFERLQKEITLMENSIPPSQACLELVNAIGVSEEPLFTPLPETSPWSNQAHNGDMCCLIS